jgi:replicative DNA helicase
VDFYAEAHRLIHQHITTLIAKGVPADVITLGESLSRAGRLDYVGGLPYLGALLEATPTAANVAHYAKIVRERAQLRPIMATAIEIGSAASAPSAPATSVLLRI